LKRRLLAPAAVATAVAAATASATPAARDGAQFRTTQPPMLSATVAGVRVTPLLTVGERVGANYVFESIPDGIAVHARSSTRTDIYVNHETSTVPFPATLTDYTNAILSRLILNPRRVDVVSGRYVIPSSANFHRFCSNFLATRVHGFSRPMVFTNEEATDVVARTGPQSFPVPAGVPGEQAGLVVAYDIRRNRYRAIYGMGRHNHENNVAIPGYRRPVMLSGDDTFSAPSSQLYMYTARNANAVWNDRGTLWGFVSSDPAINDYGDLQPGRQISGRFIRVPRDVAIADQTALENWSNQNNVFQFIRVEDIAYDRRQTNVVYLADTGEPRALPDATTGRLRRGPAGTRGPYPNGRIFRMVLDRRTPTVVRSLSVLIDGDAQGPASAGVSSLIHNPDNLETTRRALLIQEDPGTQNQFAPDNPTGTNARVWRYDLRSRALTVVAQVNQAQDPRAPLGSWESSGIVDASAAFGRGAFLLDVQAHTLFVSTQQLSPTLTAKREGGQLLLVRIPGT
jgi:hypothetical protein